jgi:hypothetical protein
MRRVLALVLLVFLPGPALLFAQRDSLRKAYLDADSWFLFVRGHFNSVGNTLWVLLGFRTWIAYIPEDPDKQEGAEGTKERHEKTGEKPDLPPLKKGILHPASHFPPESLTPDRINEINIVYSKDYRVLNDLLIIARNFRNI